MNKPSDAEFNTAIYYDGFLNDAGGFDFFPWNYALFLMLILCTSSRQNQTDLLKDYIKSVTKHKATYPKSDEKKFTPPMNIMSLLVNASLYKIAFQKLE